MDRMEVTWLHQNSLLSDTEKRRLARDLQRHVGGSVRVEFSETDTSLHHYMTMTATTVGTILVHNPEMLAQVVQYLLQQEGSSIDDLPGNFSVVSLENLEKIEINFEVNINVGNNMALVKPESEDVELDEE